MERLIEAHTHPVTRLVTRTYLQDDGSTRQEFQEYVWDGPPPEPAPPEPPVVKVRYQCPICTSHAIEVRPFSKVCLSCGKVFDEVVPAGQVPDVEPTAEEAAEEVVAEEIIPERDEVERLYGADVQDEFATEYVVDPTPEPQAKTRKKK